MAAGGCFLLAEEADEGGLASSVGADEGDAVAALDGEVEVVEDELFAAVGHGVDLGEALDLDDGAARGGRLRDGEVDGGFFFGDLDALDLFQLFDARLNLFCLGGLVAEAVDEGFEGFDAVALVLVGVHQLRAALFFLHDIFFVVAVVDVHALVPELDGLVDGDVEEVAVVRDEDVGVGIVVEVVFEPVAGLEVEVVGGLVEEEERRFLEEEFRQRDAHLPAAGELFGLALPVFFGKAEAAEDGADLCVEGVDVVNVELVGDVGVALGGGGVLFGFWVGGGEGMGEVFGFAFESVEVVEDGEALGKDGFAAEGEAVLREVAEGHAFDTGELAVVEGLDAGEDLEEGGFAGAVAADEASALVRRDEPVGVFEEEFLAEAFAGGGELEHAPLFSHWSLVTVASAFEIICESCSRSSRSASVNNCNCSRAPDKSPIFMNASPSFRWRRANLGLRAMARL